MRPSSVCGSHVGCCIASPLGDGERLWEAFILHRSWHHLSRLVSGGAALKTTRGCQELPSTRREDGGCFRAAAARSSAADGTAAAQRSRLHVATVTVLWRALCASCRPREAGFVPLDQERRVEEQNVAKDFKALTGGGSRSARGGASTRPLLGCCRDASPGPAGARAAEASCRKLRHSDGICHTVIASQVMNSFPPTVMWNAQVTGRMPPDRLGTREADATGNASTAPPSAAAVAAAAAAAHHAPLPAPHAGAGAHVEEGDGRRAEESKEESILAALGIVGTVLNLLVIVFVYIYTAT
ncbi:protein TUNAR [Lampetra planeri]